MKASQQSDSVAGSQSVVLPRFTVSTLFHLETGLAFGMVAVATIFLVRHEIRAQARLEAESKARLLFEAQPGHLSLFFHAAQAECDEANRFVCSSRLF